MEKIAVVIPCYKVKQHIDELVSKIGAEVTAIYIIDDCCPEESGKYVSNLADNRIKIIYHKTNQGVGGAVITGYKAALSDGADIIVKIDGDGQMDPSLISNFIAPILCNEADYTKGNRFYDIESIRSMPIIRLIGNMGLSFLTKLSSGYWNLFDPTNGYTAISASVVRCLPLEKINKRYFFESDMLFRLNTFKAVIIDIPMRACYEKEKSNMKITEQIFPFFIYNLKNTCKRFCYNYLFRNFNFASIECLGGIFLSLFGVVFGLFSWIEHVRMNTLSSSGTVMLSALPTILGLQLILGFINYDMSTLPSIPLCRRLCTNSQTKIKK